MSDDGAVAVVGCRPAWLWGFEHGVNQHRVAIGNEAVYTVDDAEAQDVGLIGMDLVRLGLERGASAAAAIDIMTELLDRHGQGGDCYEEGGSYFSSFLVADPYEAWVLETSARTWTAKRITDTAAISNRLSLRDDWDQSSPDVESGDDFDRWRDLEVGTGFADVRLAASRSCLSRGAAALTPRDLAAHLRHHGSRPWGAPGGDPSDVSPLPEASGGDAEFSVCMHIRGSTNTTAAMICELTQDPGQTLRAWIALGSPCASVFVPVFPPYDVPPEMSDEMVWRRFAELRNRVEADDAALAEVRSVLGPLEADLWDGADVASDDSRAQRDFVESAWPRVAAALGDLD
jgi:secernin